MSADFESERGLLPDSHLAHREPNSANIFEALFNPHTPPRPSKSSVILTELPPYQRNRFAAPRKLTAMSQAKAPSSDIASQEAPSSSSYVLVSPLEAPLLICELCSTPPPRPTTPYVELSMEEILAYLALPPDDPKVLAAEKRFLEENLRRPTEAEKQMERDKESVQRSRSGKTDRRRTRRVRLARVRSADVEVARSSANSTGATTASSSALSPASSLHEAHLRARSRFDLTLQEGETPERVRLARIELDFGSDEGVAEEDRPVIVALNPVMLETDLTQRNIGMSYGLSISGSAFGLVSGSVSFSRTVTQTETAGITISGSGPPHSSLLRFLIPKIISPGLGTSRARWLIRENPQTLTGIPESIPTALFLQHKPGVPFKAKMTVDLRVGRGTTARVGRGWWLKDFNGEFGVELDGVTQREPVGEEVGKALRELMGEKEPDAPAST
ncbi:hypothetical protein P7C70_g5372, partial [Phenoliferia sp. Uapishka_3]